MHNPTGKCTIKLSFNKNESKKKEGMNLPNNYNIPRITFSCFAFRL